MQLQLVSAEQGAGQRIVSHLDHCPVLRVKQEMLPVETSSVSDSMQQIHT